MSESKKVYVVMNGSYGEVVGVATTIEAKNRLITSELEKYLYTKEYIQAVIDGVEFSDFAYVLDGQLVEE